LEGDFSSNQGQNIRFQETSRALPSRQLSFDQRAVFRQAVNQPQRTTKPMRRFRPPD
jgi:hypothetical protein